MFTVFGVTIVLYFIKILSGSRNFYSKELEEHVRYDERIFTIDEDLIKECRAECW